MQTWLGGSTHISMPNFVKIGRSIVEIKNFQIFKMATAVILDFLNCEILLAIWVKKVDTHQHAKCR